MSLTVIFMHPQLVKHLFRFLKKHCDLVCAVQGPTGRPGMIGTAGVVGEKVKKLTVTPFANRMYETNCVWISYILISVSLRGRMARQVTPVQSEFQEDQ